MRKLLNFETV